MEVNERSQKNHVLKFLEVSNGTNTWKGDLALCFFGSTLSAHIWDGKEVKRIRQKWKDFNVKNPFVFSVYYYGARL